MTNKYHNPPISLRQGDVLLVDAAYVGGLPKNATKQESSGNKVILALGEATGHHHRFEFVNTDHNVKMFHGSTGDRFINVEAPNGLLHEEHEMVPPKLLVGEWVLPIQVEYIAKELVRVAD